MICHDVHIRVRVEPTKPGERVTSKEAQEYVLKGLRLLQDRGFPLDHIPVAATQIVAERVVELEAEDNEFILAGDRSILSPSISAETYSDDRVFEIEFDAAPYFAAMNDDILLKLANSGYGGNEAADNVAIFMMRQNLDISDMFSYLDRKGDIGFECHVNENDALEWLKQHRPTVYEKLMETEA